MKFLILIGLVYAFNIVDCVLNESFANDQWILFKSKHRRLYGSQRLETLRLRIFKNNLDLIEKHNAEFKLGLHTYTVGVNDLTDRTPSEIRKLLGYRPSLKRNLNQNITIFNGLRGLRVPDTVDWRTSGIVTPVKNQGSCGSCYAFATTGALEAATARQTGILPVLSEQQIVDCSSNYGNQGCNGGLMQNSYTYLKYALGSRTSQSYPYRGRKATCNADANVANIGATVADYVSIKSGDENALKEAIATIGPISVAMDVEDSFYNYRNGVYTDTKCRSTQFSLNHAVLAVGYGTDAQTGVDYWLIKNSWGTSWGDTGYIKMARNRRNQCGIATDATYPII